MTELEEAQARIAELEACLEAAITTLRIITRLRSAEACRAKAQSALNKYEETTA